MLLASPALATHYFFYEPAGQKYPSQTTGDAAGIAAAYTALGSDGWLQATSGASETSFGTIPSGISVVRQSWRGTDFLGTPLRYFDRTSTQRLQADSSGIAVTGKVTVADSARVGSSSTAAPLVVGGGVTAYGASTFHRGVTWNANPTFGAAVNNFTFGAAGGVTISNSAALSLGGSNNGTVLRVGATGAGDVTVTGYAVVSDSARVGASGSSAPLVVAGKVTAWGGITASNGANISKVLATSADVDFDLSGDGVDEKSFALTGAALNDVVIVGAPNGAITGTDIVWSGWVSSANVVTVRCISRSGTPNPPSGTWKVTVLQH